SMRSWVHQYYNNLVYRHQPLTEHPLNPNIAVAMGLMCARTDAEALQKADSWAFFRFALGYYGRHGVDNPGACDIWKEFQDWRHTDKGQDALRLGLIGS